MEDFKNSIAHLNVDIQTAVSVSSVVGENFSRFLYVTRNSVAALKNAKVPLLITKDTYAEELAKLFPDAADADKVELMSKNLASLFDYAASAQGYLIDATTYAKFKYYGYFVYLETEYELTSEGALAFTADTVTALKAVEANADTAFSSFIMDLAVNAATSETEAPSSVMDDFMFTLGAFAMPVAVFARGATAEFAWKDADLSVGYSPALYQLGRTLGFINASGTPIGNSFDFVACNFQDVLPTRNTSTSVLVSPAVAFGNWCKTNHVAYFKAVGNGTSNIAAEGGWTLKNTCVSAEWIVAYVNYMVRVRVAEHLTAMNTMRNALLYNKCLLAISDYMAGFIALGRITNFQITAPGWGEAQLLGNRETIVIPNAWHAVYNDNARKVSIQGEIEV